MKYRIFILGLITVLFTACAINEEDHSTPAIETEEEFYATIEGATTKVYVDEDLKVLWHADDRVSIFNKSIINSIAVVVDQCSSNCWKTIFSTPREFSLPEEFCRNICSVKSNVVLQNHCFDSSNLVSCHAIFWICSARQKNKSKRSNFCKALC